MSRSNYLFIVAIVSSIAGSAGTVEAQLLTDQRCQNAFNVTPGQAQSRYAWGLFCRNNPATNPLTGNLYPPTKYLTDASLQDYNTRADLQPWLFPTYFDFVSFQAWDIPADAYAFGNNCLAIPTSAQNVGLCVAGCYTENMKIAFADGEVGIADALSAGKVDLVTLDPDAALDNLTYTKNTVESYTVDIEEGWQPIFHFTMASGGTLSVTQEHPIVTADGRMRQAEDLAVGDSLVRADGSKDEIVDIAVEDVFNKVYNVKPKTKDYTSNIVVAQGYLNGSSRYQNQFLDMINSVILRRALAAFPE